VGGRLTTSPSFTVRAACRGSPRHGERGLDVLVECTATQTRVFGESCKPAETQIQTQHTSSYYMPQGVLRFDRGTEFVRLTRQGDGVRLDFLRKREPI